MGFSSSKVLFYSQLFDCRRTWSFKCTITCHSPRHVSRDRTCGPTRHRRLPHQRHLWFQSTGQKMGSNQNQGLHNPFSYYLHVRKSGKMGLRRCECSSACGQMVPTRLTGDHQWSETQTHRLVVVAWWVHLYLHLFNMRCIEFLNI